MRFSRNALQTILATGLTFTTFSLHAAESVKILVGGPASERAINDKMVELKKLVSVPIEVTIAKRENGVAALINDKVDGITTGTLEETAKFAEKNNLGNFDVEEYQAKLLTEAIVRVGVHPDNPVKSLTRDQIADILKGKLKTWESINGRKDPIVVLMAKNYFVIQKGVSDHYLKGESSPVAQMVLDKDGLIFGLQKNKNALGFFTEKDKHSDFTPKYIETDCHLQTFLIMKKKAQANAQKVFDFLTKK